MFLILRIQEHKSEIFSQEFSGPLLSTIRLHTFWHTLTQNINLTTSSTYIELTIRATNLRTSTFIIVITANITRHWLVIDFKYDIYINLIINFFL
jgi:hypothetical protein